MGLFLGQDIPAGRSFAETADLIHDQGGVVLIPHPATADTPPAELLRAHADRVDCVELANPAGGPAQRPVLRAARELGLIISAGSGAGGPEGLGTVGVEMRPFGDGRDFRRCARRQRADPSTTTPCTAHSRRAPHILKHCCAGVRGWPLNIKLAHDFRASTQTHGQSRAGPAPAGP